MCHIGNTNHTKIAWILFLESDNDKQSANYEDHKKLSDEIYVTITPANRHKKEHVIFKKQRGNTLCPHYQDLKISIPGVMRGVKTTTHSICTSHSLTLFLIDQNNDDEKENSTKKCNECNKTQYAIHDTRLYTKMSRQHHLPLYLQFHIHSISGDPLTLEVYHKSSRHFAI